MSEPDRERDRPERSPLSPWFQLPPEHPLQGLALEQDALLRLAERLERTLQRLDARPAEQPEHLLDVLCLVHYLGRAEPHRRKKEEALLPELEQAGEPELASRVRERELRLAALRERVRRLAAEQDPLPAAARREQLLRAGRELAARTRLQVAAERGDLFPRALACLDPAAWARVTARCLELGTCLARIELRRAPT